MSGRDYIDQPSATADTTDSELMFLSEPPQFYCSECGENITYLEHKAIVASTFLEECDDPGCMYAVIECCDCSYENLVPLDEILPY